VNHVHSFNVEAARVHRANAKWWIDINTGEPITRNVGELLMLCVSELSEALEGHRKNLMDDKLPHRKMFEVELADCVIRILDIAGGLGLDLGGAYEEKIAYNAVRHDHTIEGRKAADGKKY
jgi:NTP pyrophosphatase (non-canonical NTP hydrolase)